MIAHMSLMQACRGQRALLMLAAGCSLAMPNAASAQGDAPSFAGKQIALVIGYASGGGYDQYARLLATFIGNHLPGKPAIVPRNMLGAGTRVAANHLYNVAPKDGTAIGMLDQNLPLDQAMGDPGIKFDVRKFNWLGNLAVMNNTLVSWHTSGVTTFADAQQKPILMGGPGGPSPAVFYPRAANALLGAKFKIVTGYPDMTAMNLAMERGEVQGRGSNSWQSWKVLSPDWVRDKKINILFQVGLRREPDLPDVPLMSELATNADDRAALELLASPTAFARSFVAPPGVPDALVDVLRGAFWKMVKAPDFLAEAKRQGLEIEPVAGKEVQQLVENVLQTPPPVVERLKHAIEG